MPQLSWSQEKVKIFKYMTNLDTNEDIFDFIKKQIKSQEVDIKRLSYDQINIYINLFMVLYSKFNNKFHFLYKHDNIKEDITKNCIKNFAKGTKYCIYREFVKWLIKEKQKENISYMDLLSEIYKMA